MDGPYVMGMDFGTDSVRVLLLDAQTGQEVSSAVADYPRWSAGGIAIPIKDNTPNIPPIIWRP